MQKEPSASPRSIGVFKFKNIGDVILMTPVLRALKENFPEAKISVALNSESACLLEGHPLLHRVFAYERRFKKRNFLRTLVYEIRFFLRLRRQKFDLTLDFDQGDRSAWYGWLCGARERWTYWKRRNRLMSRLPMHTRTFEFPPTHLHQVEWHLRMLSEAGLRVPEKPVLEVQVSGQDHAWAVARKKEWGAGRLVLVHPIARWLFKRWDPVKMAQVIDWLQQERKALVVISNGGTARELKKVRKILESCSTTPLLLAGETTLSQLAALIQLGDCFLGIDTGPMHLAAAVGTPVVSLFGATQPENWGPWCERKVILKGNCICGPRETPPCQWDQVRLCMQSITVEEVKQALDRFL